MRAIISGVGHFAPDRKLTNADLERMVDTNDEWITTRTGIKERRILDPETGTSEMAVPAARMALDRAGVSPSDLDLVIVATVTPDRPVPSMAAYVQDALGADRCWGFDINGGCAGFLCALTTGAQFIEAGRHRRVLVVGADKMSAITDYQDRNTCILFGDAAGAVVLCPADSDDAGITDFELHLDGTGAPYLYIAAGGAIEPASHETVDARRHYVYQDGRVVFKHAVNAMADVAARLLDRNGVDPAALKLLIPHQANYRIIDAVARKLNLRPDQVMINIQRYGNTTAATIPMAMSEAYAAGRLSPGDPVVISAFGAGFTWGGILLTWQMAQPAPEA